jgi:hypothetical protein
MARYEIRPQGLELEEPSGLRKLPNSKEGIVFYGGDRKPKPDARFKGKG